MGYCPGLGPPTRSLPRSTANDNRPGGWDASWVAPQDRYLGVFVNAPTPCRHSLPVSNTLSWLDIGRVSSFVMHLRTPGITQHTRQYLHRPGGLGGTVEQGPVPKRASYEQKDQERSAPEPPVRQHLCASDAFRRLGTGFVG